ncbi:hypothetical protein DIPPA_19410 [Diplonema papillatum]|nr:hypothetical protein DIPPA_09011 [Diplonema papillatum]KAJ9471777.1 hypothetical protein DIPPA_19410 [Diplonema papillatum]
MTSSTRKRLNFGGGSISSFSGRPSTMARECCSPFSTAKAGRTHFSGSERGTRSTNPTLSSVCAWRANASLFRPGTRGVPNNFRRKECPSVRRSSKPCKRAPGPARLRSLRRSIGGTAVTSSGLADLGAPMPGMRPLVSGGRYPRGTAVGGS